MVNQKILSKRLKNADFGTRTRIAFARADLRDLQRSRADGIVDPLEKEVRAAKLRNLARTSRLTPKQKKKVGKLITREFK